MQVDENTSGSLSNQEAVRVLKGWLLALYIADLLICVMISLGKGHSMVYGFWLLAQSLFFSYVVGFVLLVIVIRYLGKVVGIAKITPISLLRYCVLFAFVSVIMGGILGYRLSPVASATHLKNV